jgi:hypothetical protein
MNMAWVFSKIVSNLDAVFYEFVTGKSSSSSSPSLSMAEEGSAGSSRDSHKKLVNAVSVTSDEEISKSIRQLSTVAASIRQKADDARKDAVKVSRQAVKIGKLGGEKNRQKSLALLERKRRFERIADNYDRKADRLDKRRSDVENARISAVTVEAVKEGSNVLRSILNNVSVDEVDEDAAVTTETVTSIDNLTEEFIHAQSQPGPTLADQDDLEEELDSLLASEKEQQQQHIECEEEDEDEDDWWKDSVPPKRAFTAVTTKNKKKQKKNKTAERIPVPAE